MEKGIRNTDKINFLVDEKLQKIEIEFLTLMSHQLKHKLQGKQRLCIFGKNMTGAQAKAHKRSCCNHFNDVEKR